MREVFIEKQKRVKVDLLRCTRSDSTYASCSICESICPVSAIRYRKNEVIIDESCTECSLCAGACPSEAISFDLFDSREFISSYKEDSPEEIFCSSKLPCLGVFANSDLLSLLLNKNSSITLNTYKCKECEYNDKDSVVEEIKKRADEANRLAKAIGINYNIEIGENKPNEKRALFDKGLSFIRKSASLEAYDSREYLSRLEILQDALKKQNLESQKIEVGFSAEVMVDSNCTFCQECSTFCPTKAIQNIEDGGKRVLEFYQGQCIACDVCSTICKTNSITLSHTIDIKSFTENRSSRVAEANIKLCKECKCGFYSNHEENICSICKERLAFEDMMGFAKA